MSFYITTPIFYVNAQPHLGHAYSTIIADTVARFQKTAGNEVRFQTGTDEHGDKIAEAAARSNETPREYVDRISLMFREAWPPLHIEPDNFIRTTDATHIRTVQDILRQVHDRGDIYFSEYSGLYCKGCERFLTEKELVDGNCPDHLTPPEPITEQNYFFRMSKYQEWLIGHIEQHPDFIQPERYRNEVLSFLKEPLEDLCISRPTSRLTWGIPLPFDDKFVTYVWFDALINYLTGIGYPDGPDFARYWQGAEHLIAKDILKPHAIYWPTMLKSLGLEPYRKLHVHGYWNVNETKMSKSIGNVIRPADLIDECGADSVRYFLLREMSFGLDSSFSYDALINRHNSDLANDLGNLFSRSLTMVKNFCAGRVPAPGPLEEGDRELAEAAVTMIAEYRRHMEVFAFHLALREVWKVIAMANRYIVGNAPWELAKEPANRERLDTVLFTLLESLRLITLSLHPVMPATAAKMRAALGVAAPPDLDRQAQWGLLVPAAAVTPGAALFPRLKKTAAPPAPTRREQPKGRKKPAEPGGPESVTDHGISHPAGLANLPSGKRSPCDRLPESSLGEGLISFDRFKEVDLRVGEITGAEKIKKSDRLLKLTVKAPEERTIVAGIAEFYQPDELPGKKVIIVANLKPTKLMGVTSQGMVLAARDGDRLVLTTVSGSARAGSKVA